MEINKKCEELGKRGSAIRELFEYGKKRKLEVGEENVFDFSLGNPSVPCPKEFSEKLIELLQTKDSTFLHGYTSQSGDSGVKAKICEHLQKEYQAELDPDLLYMTCGAAAGLTIAFKAIRSSEQDEIIVFAPHFPEYSVFIEHAGLKKVLSYPDKDMLIDFVDLENKLNHNTKAVLIDSPNNPTGVVYDESIIIRLSKLLKEKSKEYGHPIYLISDEPYRELIYSDKKYPFVTNYYDNSLVIYSFSKSLSLPGERIGYLAVNPKMEDASRVYAAILGAGRSMGFVNAPSLFQHALPYALEMKSNLKAYMENRELLYKGLIELGYEVIYPEGAFYMFVKALEEDANKFMEKAKTLDLLLVSSESFGIKGYVRIAYCVKKETIINSIPRFKKLKEMYGDK